MKIKLILLVSIIATVFFLGSTSVKPQVEGYVGSEKCLLCHRNLHSEIVKSWQDSKHHTTMRLVSENKNILENLKMTSSLKKEDVLAIIGHQDKRYVFVRSDFQVFASEQWQDEESDPPHDEIGTEGKKVDATQQCFGCHATGYFVSQKKFAEPGVGCEACHGPGKKHVDSNGLDGTIVNPAKLSPARNRMVCGQCHSLGKDISGKHPFPVMSDGKTRKPFQPGQDLHLGFVDAKPVLVRKGWEYSLFVQSAERYSKQLCTDCHDPHGKESPSMLVDATSELCLRCHGVGSDRLAYENHWGLGNVIKWPCWDCHRKAHQH